MTQERILKRIKQLAESLAVELETTYDFQYNKEPIDLINELDELAYAAEMTLERMENNLDY